MLKKKQKYRYKAIVKRHEAFDAYSGTATVQGN